MTRRVGFPYARRGRAGSVLVVVALLCSAAAFVACDGAPPKRETPPAPFSPVTYAAPVGPERDHVGEVETGTITPNVALSSALSRANVEGPDIDAIAAALRPLFDFRLCRPGHTFDILRDAEGKVAWFRYVAGPTTILHAYRDSDGRMVGAAQAVLVQTSTVFVSAIVDHSLYMALETAGEGPALTLEIVELFAWDIDFFTEPRKGDRVRVIVEKRYVDGVLIGYGRILGAEYRMGDTRVHRAFFYLRLDGGKGYYQDDGLAVKKAFLKSPIRFASVTSRYGMRRHPILKRKRAHRGVDYGAPRGTAIWAIGDGVVRFAGRKGGFGNFLVLRHANGLQTRYAHLRGFAKGVRAGRRVAQKQVIGYVGSTGMSTGPHLHFEVLRNGRQVNPLSVAVPPAPPIPKPERAAYKEAIAPIVAALDAGRAPGDEP